MPVRPEPVYYYCIGCDWRFVDKQVPDLWRVLKPLWSVYVLNQQLSTQCNNRLIQQLLHRSCFRIRRVWLRWSKILHDC